MIVFKKNIATSIAFCISAFFQSAQALITVELMQEFLQQNNPEQYQSVHQSSDKNPTACQDGLAEILEALASNKALNEAGTTPLDVAVQVQHGAWIDAVLNYSNSTNIRSLRSFKQLLELAITNNSQLFLSPKWTKEIVNQPLNSNGDTGIILAAQAGRKNLFEQLYGIGADPEKRNIAGNNAQMIMS